MIDAEGNLMAAAWATPPPWINTSYAAEMWALWLVVKACPCSPNIITDCKAVLGTMRAGAQAATASRRKLARAWILISDALGGSITSMVTQHQVVWMPAHTSGGSRGIAQKSDGKKVTATQWRANQLADALAKKGAPQFTTNKGIDELYDSACGATQQAAALLI